METKDELGTLEPYFPDGIKETELDKIEELHAIFHRDFFEHTVVIDQTPLKVKPYLYKKQQKGQSVH